MSDQIITNHKKNKQKKKTLHHLQTRTITIHDKDKQKTQKTLRNPYLRRSATRWGKKTMKKRCVWEAKKKKKESMVSRSRRKRHATSALADGNSEETPPHLVADDEPPETRYFVGPAVEHFLADF